jgi:peptidoglycan hydrolase-like protein with peptidoglycan-binding domain
MKTIPKVVAVVAVLVGTLAVPSAASAATETSCANLTTFKVFNVDNNETDTMQVPTTASGNKDTDCILGRGSQGWGVVALQLALNSCANAGLKVDGVYGPATEAAVKWMQGTQGITTDGVYGPQTRKSGAVRFPVVNQQGALTACVIANVGAPLV